MVDDGSLDGGLREGSGARPRDAVAAGLRPDLAFPEIYHPGMAAQWAALSHWAATHAGGPLSFAGVLTQSRAGFTPAQGYQHLLGALDGDYPDTHQSSLGWSSNMTGGG